MRRKNEAGEGSGLKVLPVDKLRKHGSLRRLTTFHGRSFSLSHRQALELLPSARIDADYSIKGLPDDIPIIRTADNPAGLRVDGLVPRGETRRAKMKQDFLLANGLPTEKFLEIYDLITVPDTSKGTNVRISQQIRQKLLRQNPPEISVTEWKRRVIEQLEFRKTHDSQEYFRRFDDPMVFLEEGSDYDYAADYIRRTDFVVVFREQPLEAAFTDLQAASEQDSHFTLQYQRDTGITVPIHGNIFTFKTPTEFEKNIPQLIKGFKERSYIQDTEFSSDDIVKAYQNLLPRLKQAEARGDESVTLASTYFADQLLTRAFQFINNSERYRDNPLVPDGGFDLANDAHLIHFFRTFIPLSMGDYLTEVHNFGIAHGFAHDQNWKLGVFLVDLDSMKGVPFGDALPPVEDYINDVQLSIEAIDSLFHLHTLGVARSPIAHSYLANRFLDHPATDQDENRLFALRKEMVCQFIARYLGIYDIPSMTEHDQTTLISNYLDNVAIEIENYTVDPPISREDYGDRILQIVRGERE